MFLYTGKGATNQHYVLKEVADGNTPNRDAGNAISQRQGSVGGFVAMQAGSPEEGTGVKLYAHDIEPYLPGDVDGDAQLTCSDVSAATASIGKRAGEPGYLRNADLDQDGVVEMRDIVAIRQLLPAGMRCQ